MRKQRKVRVRMRFTLYFLGVKESHFDYLNKMKLLISDETKFKKLTQNPEV